MGFAARYLQKHAFRDPFSLVGGQPSALAAQPFIRESPDPHLNAIVAIPATSESGLTTCLDALFLCDPAAAPAEVIVLINSGEHSPQEVILQNRTTYEEAVSWAHTHRRDDLRFHIVLAEGLPAKHYGAGLARKLVMDEAVRRFDAVDRQDGVILSLDADTVVRKDYLREVTALFEREPLTEGCAIQFRHPLSQEEYTTLFGALVPFPQEVYDAIVNYELHQRYYLQAVRYTGYPWAFHTVGSSFAVRAGVYCRQGGMSRRQAGEDFYFIQKVAMQGQFTACNTTTVYPSPRPSDRVPFGTGPDIARQLSAAAGRLPGQVPYPTYHPNLFVHLKLFYDQVPEFYRTDDPEGLCRRTIQQPLQQYLKKTGFYIRLEEIRRNTATEETFRQRFFRKFNMFWLLKYLHFAEERGIEKAEIAKAAQTMLEWSGSDAPGTFTDTLPSKRALLNSYRHTFS